jgi:hypothetical protein
MAVRNDARPQLQHADAVRREAKREQLGQHRATGLGDAVFAAIERGELCFYRDDRDDRARRPVLERTECSAA